MSNALATLMHFSKPLLNPKDRTVIGNAAISFLCHSVDTFAGPLPPSPLVLLCEEQNGGHKELWSQRRWISYSLLLTFSFPSTRLGDDPDVDDHARRGL